MKGRRKIIVALFQASTDIFFFIKGLPYLIDRVKN